MQVKIHSISTACASNSISLLELAQKFGKSVDFIHNKIGVTNLPRLAENESGLSLALQACDGLSSVSFQDIGLLIYVTQNPHISSIPQMSTRIQHELGISTKCITLDLSLGCSAYPIALNMASNLCSANNIDSALVITSDQYSPYLEPSSSAEQLIFGDGATATYLSLDGSFLVGKLYGGSDGSKHLAIKKISDRITMNGRKVFDFCSNNIPPHIYSHIQSEGLNQSNLDKIILHQGSKAIIDSIKKNLPDYAHLIYSDMVPSGNTISSSLPFSLSSYLQTITKSSRANLLLCGFGVGLTWSSILLKKP